MFGKGIGKFPHLLFPSTYSERLLGGHRGNAVGPATDLSDWEMQMSKRQGLVFNPEALELFAMGKVFLLYSWLKVIGIEKPRSKLKDMLRMFGFEITDQLYDLIEEHPHP
jgi:hypothetical protein